MTIEFFINPYQQYMDVIVSYEKNEIIQNYFFLNRDFVINKCIIDGANYDLCHKVEIVTLEWLEGYRVKKYSLPELNDKITIEYTGHLSGNTGSWPYVRETISPSFTFIRWETFCYPIFFSDDRNSLRSFLFNPACVNMLVTVPDNYTAVADADEVNIKTGNSTVLHSFSAQHMGVNIAVAKYNIKHLSVGTFYLLGEINRCQVENTINKTHAFMNTRFGKRVIANTRYISVPSKLGGFTRPNAVFVEAATFESENAMSHIIHEFIHLGWNVPADNETQGIRFFDEAFTSYFEMRAMEHLCPQNKNSRLTDFIYAYKNQIARPDINTDIPIAKFGEHGYGDLSYTIGAICLFKLSELVGLELFDNVTREFLQKYKNTPVNMKDFCQFYVKSCNNPEIEQFFECWIYTANGPRAFIQRNM